MTSLAHFDRVRSTVIEGTLENVRYRQNELLSLCRSLQQNADSVIEAIQTDFHQSRPQQAMRAEAEAEYYLTMLAVKRFYQSLDFEKSIKDEYLISNNLDNASRSVGLGLVIIRPTSHTRFNSIVCPLAAAIAAGNCVCLQMGDTLLAVDKILKQLLQSSLNQNSFLISGTSLPDLNPTPTFLVDQTGIEYAETPRLNSQPSARCIVVVDRTADIEVAAKATVKARFSFQGSSPYSPDLVIVNEFVKSDFIAACTRYASNFFASRNAQVKKANGNTESPTKKELEAAEKKRQLSLFGSTDFRIVDVHDRESAIASTKVTGHTLLVMNSSSLVDTIMSQNRSTLLAAYIFSNPETAKFVAQHLDSRSTYVNNIPTHLLIGPAAPISPHSPIDGGHKYTVQMFTQPRPQFIQPPSHELAIIDTLLDRGMDNKREVEMLRNRAVENLKPTGQRPGHAIGFFEQGIMIGVGLFLSFAVPAIGYGSWITGRSALRFLRQRYQ